LAGDIDIPEHLVLSAPYGAPGIEAFAERAETRVLHRYGNVHIVQAEEPILMELAAAPNITFASPVAAKLDDAIIEKLAPAEILGVRALTLRQSREYIGAKSNRPRQGDAWDMRGCTDTLTPGAATFGSPPPPGGAAPTSAYLEGSVAVGLVIVEGPIPALQFSPEERTKVVAEVQNGLSFYASQNPAASLTFAYDIQISRIDRAPDPTATDPEALEAVWRDPALSGLGYPGGLPGAAEYAEAIRTSLSTNWTYCAFFVKYPLYHFAYAYPGGPCLVMDYANDGWGVENIDRVFAHESGHIFGCPDEYAAARCDCGGSWGRYGKPNGNCELCAVGGPAECLMRANTWAMCNWTPMHLGWRDT
jgi:hypothetical protein